MFALTFNAAINQQQPHRFGFRRFCWQIAQQIARVQGQEDLDFSFLFDPGEIEGSFHENPGILHSSFKTKYPPNAITPTPAVHKASFFNIFFWKWITNYNSSAYTFRERNKDKHAIPSTKI